MGQIHVDDMSVDIPCTDLRDFRGQIGGSVSVNVFCKNWPHVGARRGAFEKRGDPC